MTEQDKQLTSSLEVNENELNASENTVQAEQEETYLEMSPIRLVMRRFFRSKLSIVGLLMIAFLFLFSFLGPVIYQKWGEETVDRTKVSNFIYQTYEYTDADGNKIEVVEQLEHVSSINNYASPDKEHILGTDDKGMDVFVRLMYGGRISLTIGFIVVILETLIGVLLGGISGYFGGWVDTLLMRITEIFSSIPFLPFAMLLSQIIKNYNVGETTRIFIIMLILGALSWTGLARMIRGQVLAEREKEFVTAARAIGVRESKIAFKHVLPNIVSVILVSMTLDFAGCLLTESSLSYLGFGVQQPRPTWGNMLTGSNNSTVIQNYWWQWLFPALFLSIAVICINVIGDALRDALDPKSNKENR